MKYAILKFLYYRVFQVKYLPGVYRMRFNPCDYEGRGKKQKILRVFNRIMNNVFYTPVMRAYWKENAKHPSVINFKNDDARKCMEQLDKAFATEGEKERKAEFEKFKNCAITYFNSLRCEKEKCR